MIKSTHSPKLPTVQVDQLNVGPVERHKINYIKCGDSYFAPASSRRTANALPRPCAELVKSVHDMPCTICMFILDKKDLSLQNKATTPVQTP